MNYAISLATNKHILHISTLYGANSLLCQICMELKVSIISTTVTNITTIYPEQYIHGQCIIIGFNVELSIDVFLNQVRAGTGRCAPGFLKLFLCGCLYMCVCVCVCVSAPEAINN